jgi:hypothetical protein
MRKEKRIRNRERIMSSDERVVDEIPGSDRKVEEEEKEKKRKKKKESKTIKI